jgi:hypothetical protein
MSFTKTFSETTLKVPAVITTTGAVLPERLPEARQDAAA